MRAFAPLISVIALASGVSAAPATDIEGPYPGASVFIPEWEVETAPGGPVVTVSGTVQQAIAELEKINPNFKTDFNITDVAEADVPVPEVAGSLQKRTDFKGSKVICNNFGRAASYTAYLDGINYLRGVSGKPYAPAGPGACGRVSCSDNTAIWWCNDDRAPKTLASFGSIADGAAYLSSFCTGLPETWNGKYTIGGQVFHSTNWNVIVRRNSC
ncbi:hypothetical protein CMUS01_12544 [Colletotrichum musicola]|uniref:Secreted protein n=1 Tax=Colletotrichum musicola TaxID=2175873 RepID=A0A8H6MZP3_9PEZI|nr:hypothetical protein CMUS01_12544 [Colletotrichum musicola]